VLNATPPPKSLQIEIDSLVHIDWAEAALYADLLAQTGGAKNSPLVDRFIALQSAAKIYLDALPEILVSLRELNATFRAKLNATAAERPAAEQALDAASTQFGLRASAALLKLKAGVPRGSTYDRLEDAILLEPVPTRYAKLGEVLASEVDSARQELAESLKHEGLRVRMSAHIVGALKSAQIHLAGYDTIATGAPVPFQRFRIALDERAKAEVEASENLATLLSQLKDGTIEKLLRQAAADLKQSLGELAKKLKVDVLEPELERTRDDLKKLGDATVGPTIDSVDSALALLKSVTEVPEVGTVTTTDSLTRLAEALSGLVDAIDQSRLALPAKLTELESGLKAIAVAHAGAVRTEALEAIRNARTEFVNRQSELVDIVSVTKRTIRTLLGPVDVVLALDRINGIALEIGTADSLDTFFDLQTISGFERHPGDKVIVRTEISRPGSDSSDTETVIGADTLTLHVEAFGWYAEPRGALIFADPRNAISRDISWQPLPAFGLHWRYGSPRHPAWNGGLGLGIGFTATLMDYEDDEDFELGIAGSVTFLRQLFWAGYGRDLQARKNFVFIGINPFVIAQLARK